MLGHQISAVLSLQIQFPRRSGLQFSGYFPMPQGYMETASAFPPGILHNIVPLHTASCPHPEVFFLSGHKAGYHELPRLYHKYNVRHW